MDNRRLWTMSVVALLALAAAAPALAEDLTLAKGDATDLITSDVGKPYWQLEAQCAGMFGAAYAYESSHDRPRDADGMKQSGIDMLQNALDRLQSDRGVDQNAAMALVADHVEAGRASARGELDKYGDGPQSSWNLLRSACLDIAEAARRHAAN